MNSSALVQNLWNYCNVLRDDGVSYGDYVEQLTYQLFLKMADGAQPPAVFIPGRGQPAQAHPRAVRLARDVRQWRR